MTFLDDLIQTITQSEKFSPAAKTQITAFLTQHRDLFLQIGDAATQEFFHALSIDGPNSAYESLLAQVSEPQLLDLLKQIGPDLTAAIDRRTQILTNYRNFIEVPRLRRPATPYPSCLGRVLKPGENRRPNGVIFRISQLCRIFLYSAIAEGYNEPKR